MSAFHPLPTLARSAFDRLRTLARQLNRSMATRSRQQFSTASRSADMADGLLRECASRVHTVVHTGT
jgi:hypothetical protein